MSNHTVITEEFVIAAKPGFITTFTELNSYAKILQLTASIPAHIINNSNGPCFTFIADYLGVSGYGRWSNDGDNFYYCKPDFY